MSQIEDLVKGPRCGIENCEETLFYIDAGWKFCRRNGHQQDFRDTQEGEGQYRTEGKKTKIKRHRAERVSQILHAHSATQLFLQSYQLILWKQCHALVHTIGLPSELETVVRDLWALRLQLLEGRVDTTSGDDTVFSSQPQSEVENERGGGASREWKLRAKAMPTLIETLGVCYLGAMVLKLPTSIGEMHRWAVREVIPYMRAIRHVPPVMKGQLPPEFVAALDTTHLLESDHLRKSIHNLCLLYQHHFGLTIPRGNTPLILYKHVRDLALPINTFPAVRRIASLLSIDFAFPTPGHRQRLSALPEISLISLIVIVVKLYHPFDGFDRSAQSFTDPAVLAIDWSSWIEAQQNWKSRLENERHLAPGSAASVTERDAMKMSGEQLDDYLDWYEKTWVNDERAVNKQGGLPKQLLDMFPTGRLDGSTPTVYNNDEETAQEYRSTGQRILETMGKMKMRSVVPEDGEDREGRGIRNVGSLYKRYRRVDSLNQQARAFHEAAASAVAIKLETLLLVVLQVERKLILWRKKQLKVEREGLGEDEDTDEGHSARGNSREAEQVLNPGVEAGDDEMEVESSSEDSGAD